MSCGAFEARLPSDSSALFQSLDSEVHQRGPAGCRGRGHQRIPVRADGTYDVDLVQSGSCYAHTDDGQAPAAVVEPSLPRLVPPWPPLALPPSAAAARAATAGIRALQEHAAKMDEAIGELKQLIQKLESSAGRNPRGVTTERHETHAGNLGTHQGNHATMVKLRVRVHT
jgi:hypothetical protein